MLLINRRRLRAVITPNLSGWEQDPTDRVNAARAAYHYAKRDDVAIVVYQDGISRVYQLARETDRVPVVLAGVPVRVMVVEPDGRIFSAFLNQEV